MHEFLGLPETPFGGTEYALLDAATEPQLDPLPSQGSPRKLLVLEDDQVQLQILTQHLESLDLQTVSASTIAEARCCLGDSEFDLGIFDVQLPDGSGLDLCAELDDNPSWAGLPVVILSNSSQSDIVRRTRAAGGYYFLGKPYDPNVLIAIIERALGQAL